MASQLKVNTLTGVTTAGSINVTGEGNSTTTNLQQGLGKNWCAFNGTGTVATRDSFNTSSLVDGGTGTYVINYTNVFAVSGGQAVSGICNRSNMHLDSVPITTQHVCVTRDNSNSNADSDNVSTSCKGDLA